MKTDLIEQALDVLEKELPEIVARHKLASYPSFPYSRGTMQNRDCEGTGPTDKFFMGRYLYYTKRSLIEFVRRQMRT